MRHLHVNFREKFRGKVYKDALWVAAGAYNEANFKVKLQAMRRINPRGEEAFKYMENIPYCCWARHAFSTKSKCDQIENNNSESWNDVILESREKPIIGLFEHLRRILMRRNQERRGISIDELLYSNIHDELEKTKLALRKCDVQYAGELRFEIECQRQTFEVDLASKTCGCRKWDLTGVLCLHAGCIIANVEFLIYLGCQVSLFDIHLYTLVEFIRCIWSGFLAYIYILWSFWSGFLVEFIQSLNS